MTDINNLIKRLREFVNVGGFDDSVSGNHCRGMWVEDDLRIEAAAALAELRDELAQRTHVQALTARDNEKHKAALAELQESCVAKDHLWNDALLEIQDLKTKIHELENKAQAEIANLLAELQVCERERELFRLERITHDRMA